MIKNNSTQKQTDYNFFEGVMNWIGSVPSLIAHTVFFIISFSTIFFGVHLDKVLLVVTTVVSLEAIYMAIFIQMAVNRATRSLEEVEEDIDEIQEDVDEIQEDVGEIEKDIDDIQEDIDEIEKDDAEEEDLDKQNTEVLNKIEHKLQSLIAEIERIKKA